MDTLPTLHTALAAPFSDAAGTTLHDFACLMALADTYVRHGKYALAYECLWGAFDTARRMERPDLAYTANDRIGRLTDALDSATLAAALIEIEGGAS